MTIDDNVKKCSEDASDGYRMWHIEGKKQVSYCSLLMPQYGSKPGECPMQGPCIAIRKRTGLSRSDLSVYICLKKKE